MGDIRHASILTRDGTRLAVTHSGPRDAKHTIVAAHGLCLSKESWGLHADNIVSSNASVRFIAYDHRGHGDSGHAHLSTYTVDQLAHDLADVVKWADVRGTLTVAGHSMGGMTALAYMGLPREYRPVEPASLLLVATAAGKVATRGIGTLLELPAVRLLREHKHHVPDRVADPIIRRLSGPLVSAMMRHVGYADNRLGVAASSAAWSVNRTALRTKLGFLDALASFNAYDALPSVTADTVILSGGKDFLTPRGHADDIATAIPGARHLHFADRGHMLVDEAADTVTEILRNFCIPRVAALAS